MNPITQIAKERVRKSRVIYAALVSMIATSFMVIAAPGVSAASAVSLGQASNFAVLAGGGITNTGSTSISGDVGTYPTVSFSDTGTVSLSGTYHFGDATSIAAKADLATAYATAAAATPSTALVADLGGRTLLPGIYANPTGLGLTGTLTLDAQGDPNAVFIFQTPANLNTAAASQINIINGGQACNVFWQVGTTTDLGASSNFKGTIMTNSNFTGGPSATVLGRVLSLGGSVALNSDSITKPSCMTPTALFVVPDNQSVTYGSASVGFTAKYETVNHNAATIVANPSIGNPGWVAPTCAATPAYTPTSPVGTSVISCTGGSGGALYVLDRSDTATLTVNKVETKIAVTTSPSGSFMPGTTLSFSGVVSPKSGTGVCSGAVSFALNRNPLTGVAGAYALTNPVTTTNWMVGDYQLLATYPGDSNCLPSSNNSVNVKVGAQENTGSHVVISGGGSYLSPYGKASFNLLIKSAIANVDTSTAVNGKVTWMVPRQWRFQGTLNTYVFANGTGTATGSGTLWFWNRTGHEGKWYPATTGATNVTVMFSTSANSKGDDSRPITAFAIGFTGNLAVGAPALPVLGSLVSLGKGENQGKGEGQDHGHGHGKGKKGDH